MNTIQPIQPVFQPRPEVPVNLDEVQDKNADVFKEKLKLENEKKEETKSLTDTQTVAVANKVVEGKIEAYAAGAGKTYNTNELYKEREDVKKLQDIQDTVHKQKGLAEYQTNIVTG